MTDNSTYRLGLVDLGDLEELLVDIPQSVHSSLEGLVLGREPVGGEGVKRSGSRAVARRDGE